MRTRDLQNETKQNEIIIIICGQKKTVCNLQTSLLILALHVIKFLFALVGADASETLTDIYNFFFMRVNEHNQWNISTIEYRYFKNKNKHRFILDSISTVRSQL